MGKFYQSKKVLTAFAVTIVVAGSGLFAWNNHTNDQNMLKKQAQTQAAEKLAAEQKEHITYQGVTGKTALELLKEQHTVTTKTYSFGEQVESIDGLEGLGPKYWTFYLNGKMADVGAGSYQSQSSDTIDWKLEQL
jgi:hypothetical protein